MSVHSVAAGCDGEKSTSAPKTCMCPCFSVMLVQGELQGVQAKHMHMTTVHSSDSAGCRDISRGTPRMCMCSGASVILRGVSSRACSWGAASRQRMASLTELGHAVLYDTSCSLGLRQAQGTPHQSDRSLTKALHMKNWVWTRQHVPHSPSLGMQSYRRKARLSNLCVLTQRALTRFQVASEIICDASCQRSNCKACIVSKAQCQAIKGGAVQQK